MDLVLPQIGAFRPMDGRGAPAPNEEVLSLTFKPTEFKPAESKPALSLKDPAEAPPPADVLKHPRRFQALASPTAVKPAPLETGATETLAEPDIPKHPRRFQALISAGPAKLANRFSRRERAPEADASPDTPLPEGAPETPQPSQPAAAALQLPTVVLDALARAEASRDLPPVIVEGVPRKSKERRGVPPPLRERPAGRSLYDW